jgi:DNA-binding response OmpR family regulator
MAYALRRAGHEVITAGDGQQALDHLQADHPDIVLLELKLGRLTGFEVCRRIGLESEVPIIVVSSSHEEPDVLRALRLGADDYVTKPFSLQELAARMETVARRCRRGATERADRTVEAGDLELYLQSYEVTRGGGEPVQLTPLEFRILHLLAMNEGQIIPYARLVDHAWGYEGGDASLLKTHVCHLRAKLGLPLTGAGAIRSLATVGYSLVKHRAASGAGTARSSTEVHRARDARHDDALRHEEQLRLVTG